MRKKSSRWMWSVCVSERALLTSSSSSSAAAGAGVCAGADGGWEGVGLWKNGSSPFSSSTLSDGLRE